MFVNVCTYSLLTSSLFILHLRRDNIDTLSHFIDDAASINATTAIVINITTTLTYLRPDRSLITLHNYVY